MMKVTRSKTVAAAPAAVWDVVSSVERLPDWLTFAEAAEIMEGGDGVGRVHRIHGHWGDRRSEVDQRITEWEPPRLLTWVHDAERLDGRPAPRFARSTRFEVRLAAQPGGTRVTLASVQVPASPLKGLVMLVFGGRELAQSYERSLERLEAAVAGTRV
jgi:uncharacterized protein YndB with AHSA1/START domain